MSWLLFMDESGHDHRQMPYEVRGGIALHAGRIWPVVQEAKRVELDAFGAELGLYSDEIKGSKLLAKNRFKWATQAGALEPEARRKLCRAFLTKGLEKKVPTRAEFTAYGQACLEMARGLFELLRAHGAVLFASAIPRGVQKPNDFALEDYLRKDHVYLLERFFYFLESKREHGLLVFDECDKSEDRRFVQRLENYFTRTQTGRYRTQWIVPVPLFVASDMAYLIQLADLCIYCVNWGFRVPSIGMNADVRSEIAAEFGPWLYHLQFAGDGYRDGAVFRSFGVTCVPNPYDGRDSKKKRQRRRGRPKAAPRQSLRLEYRPSRTDGQARREEDLA